MSLSITAPEPGPPTRFLNIAEKGSRVEHNNDYSTSRQLSIINTELACQILNLGKGQLILLAEVNIMKKFIPAE